MPSYAIFGASRGIGLGFVKHLSAEKDNTVFAIVRNPATANFLIDHIKTNNLENVHIIEGDADKPNTIESSAKEIAAKTGGTLDVFIYNAVGGEWGLPLLSYPSQKALVSDFAGAFEANVYAPIHAATVFLPLLLASKSKLKKLVAISSGVADPDFNNKSEFPGATTYSISKAALYLAWSKIAVELKGRGDSAADEVVCLTLSPGLVNTSATQPNPPSESDMAGYMSMVKSFQKVKTSFQGPISVEESVKMSLDVIEKVTIEDSGKFLSHFGNTTEFI